MAGSERLKIVITRSSNSKSTDRQKDREKCFEFLGHCLKSENHFCKYIPLLLY